MYVISGRSGTDSLSETKHLVVSTVGRRDAWMSAVQRNLIHEWGIALFVRCRANRGPLYQITKFTHTDIPPFQSATSLTGVTGTFLALERVSDRGKRR
jgi:hypothetical protein